jgi:hypothetical protein
VFDLKHVAAVVLKVHGQTQTTSFQIVLHERKTVARFLERLEIDPVARRQVNLEAPPFASQPNRQGNPTVIALVVEPKTVQFSANSRDTNGSTACARVHMERLIRTDDTDRGWPGMLSLENLDDAAAKVDCTYSWVRSAIDARHVGIDFKYRTLHLTERRDQPVRVVVDGTMTYTHERHLTFHPSQTSANIIGLHQRVCAKFAADDTIEVDDGRLSIWSGADVMYHADGRFCRSDEVATLNDVRVRCILRMAYLYARAHREVTNKGVTWKADAVVLLDSIFPRPCCFPDVTDAVAATLTASVRESMARSYQDASNDVAVVAFPSSRTVRLPLADFESTSPVAVSLASAAASAWSETEKGVYRLRTDGGTDPFDDAAASQLADLLDTTCSHNATMHMAATLATATTDNPVPFPSDLAANLVACADYLGYRPASDAVRRLQAVVDACLDERRCLVTPTAVVRLLTERRVDARLPCSADKLLTALLSTAATTTRWALFGATAADDQIQLIRLLGLVDVAHPSWLALAAWVEGALAASVSWLVPSRAALADVVVDVFASPLSDMTCVSLDDGPLLRVGRRHQDTCERHLATADEFRRRLACFTGGLLARFDDADWADLDVVVSGSAVVACILNPPPPPPLPGGATRDWGRYVEAMYGTADVDLYCCGCPDVDAWRTQVQVVHDRILERSGVDLAVTFKGDLVAELCDGPRKVQVIRRATPLAETLAAFHVDPVRAAWDGRRLLALPTALLSWQTMVIQMPALLRPDILAKYVARGFGYAGNATDAEVAAVHERVFGDDARATDPTDGEIDAACYVQCLHPRSIIRELGRAVDGGATNASYLPNTGRETADGAHVRVGVKRRRGSVSGDEAPPPPQRLRPCTCRYQ